MTPRVFGVLVVAVALGIAVAVTQPRPGVVEHDRADAARKAGL